jgi:hypothetical protein
MSLLEYAWNWNATVDECRAAYPCDEYIRGPHSVFMRAIDIEALSSVVYRWVCQVKVAPHSYARQLDVNGHHRPTWSQTTPARPIKARGFGLQMVADGRFGGSRGGLAGHDLPADHWWTAAGSNR